MENRDEMELLLWDYIDGRCSVADQQRAAQLIAENPEWRAMHAELVSFNAAIAREQSLEHPSMRFTKNIMDTVAGTKIAPAAKNYINYNIIKGIAAFFLLAIAGLFAITFSNINWQSSYTPAPYKANIDLRLTAFANPMIMNIIIAMGILLGLLFTDRLLRNRKLHSRQ